MVRERKTRVKDIEKLHELIDSASLPKQRAVSSYEAEKLESLRKQLSNDSYNDHKQVDSSKAMPITTEGFTPRVVIHKQEEIPKKDQKVIQIDLGPRPLKKEKEQPVVNFLPVKEDPFARESLYEIEKISTPKKTLMEVKPITLTKKTQVQKEFIPVISNRMKKEEHLPDFLPVSKGSVFSETSEKAQEKLVKEFSQKSEPTKEETKEFLSFPQSQENEIPSFEPVELQTATTEKKEPMRFEMQKKSTENRKQKKFEEKKAKQEAKEKEQEEKRLAKEKEKKLKIETIAAQQKQQVEHQQKEMELKQAFVQAEEKEREEQRLQKEQEKKSRLEIIERQKKEKEKRKQKKIDEKKARLEVKEKKQEAKRLAKDHDRKLKLEWIEFQHKQTTKSEKEGPGDEKSCGGIKTKRTGGTTSFKRT